MYEFKVELPVDISSVSPEAFYYEQGFLRGYQTAEDDLANKSFKK